ncbi:glycosyltransferase 87 family protein [Bdellovibrionota bacterium FG-2]
MAKIFQNPRFLAGLLIIVVSGVLFVRYPLKSVSPENAGAPGDFTVYLRASDRLAHGSSPYVSTDTSPYKYSPALAGIASLIPHERAWFLFSALSIFGLGAALFWGLPFQSLKTLGLLVIGWCLGWKGILETLDYGQIDFVLLIFGVLAARWLMEKPFWAGFIVGCLPAIKLPWILMGMPFQIESLVEAGESVRKRRSIFLLGLIAAVLSWVIVLPILFWGPSQAWELTQAWVMLLIQGQPSALFLSDINQTIGLLAWRLSGHELSVSVSALLGGAIALFLGFWVLHMRKLFPVSPRKLPLVWLAPWLLLIQLVNPLAWRWGSLFIVAIPLAVAQGQPTKEWLKHWAPLWISVIILWILQLNPVARNLGFEAWTDFHGWGLITVYWIALVLLSVSE